MPQPIIEALFVNGPHVKLLQWLYVEAKPTESYAARELARRCGLPYGSVDRALKDLVKRQLVVREDSPRGPQYRAPFEDPRLKHLFLLLRQDSEIVSLLRRALRRFKSIDYASVFGSFARGETHKGSDVDVLILENSETERLEILSTLSKLSDRIHREVNAQPYATDEFKRLLDAADPIALSIHGQARIGIKGALPWLS